MLFYGTQTNTGDSTYADCERCLRIYLLYCLSSLCFYLFILLSFLLEFTQMKFLHSPPRLQNFCKLLPTTKASSTLTQTTQTSNQTCLADVKGPKIRHLSFPGNLKTHTLACSFLLDMMPCRTLQHEVVSVGGAKAQLGYVPFVTSRRGGGVISLCGKAEQIKDVEDEGLSFL